MSGSVIPTIVDLGVSDNVVQVRHELHRAIDFGTDAERAAWAAKWGEAALSAGERLSAFADDDEPWVSDFAESLTRALETASALRTGMAADAPDVPALRSLSTTLHSRLNRLVDRLDDEA